MTRKAEILVVDDDVFTVKFFENLFLESTYNIFSSTTGTEALEVIKQGSFELVLLDLRLPDISGLEVLKEINTIENAPEVIMITGFSTVESAVEAMKLGAFDYVQKPFERSEEIRLLINKALEKKCIRDENEFLKQKIRDIALGDKIISNDPKMKSLLDIVRKVAPLENTVLITGESGTGKELIANLIHESSLRAKNRFLTVNCGALSENLLESTLFGHEKGAFTGAIRRHKGYFEVAHHGTIFLDEIGEISLSFQVKLLRVLEEKKFQRVGSTEEIYSDVRVIAATNKDLMKDVESGNFRDDLYYRINVVTISLPPLREREVDIPLLIHFYFRQFNEKLNKKLTGISAEAMEMLMKYHWPGNVRELKNVLERAVILEENEEITVSSLPDKIAGREMTLAPTYFEMPFSRSKEVFEKDYIIHALKVYHGNILKVSEKTKIPRQNIYLKIKKHGINPDLYRLRND